LCASRGRSGSRGHETLSLRRDSTGQRASRPLETKV
jgi:hypothetical protein